MRIRELQEKDLNAVGKLIKETFEDNTMSKNAKYWLKTSLKKRKDVFVRLKYWVAEEKGRIIGITGTYGDVTHPKDAYWMNYFAVKPELQRRGVGTKLYRFIEDKIKSRGARVFCIETSNAEEYAVANRFYKKMGFVECGRIKDYWKRGEDQVYLYKRLK